MADLAISISIPDDQVARLLAAFAKQWETPTLTIEQLLGLLKDSAVQQMKDVVRNQEIAALKAETEALPFLSIS